MPRFTILKDLFYIYLFRNKNTPSLSFHPKFCIFHTFSIYTGMSLHVALKSNLLIWKLINSIHVFTAPLENSIVLCMHRNLQYSIALLTEEFLLHFLLMSSTGYFTLVSQCRSIICINCNSESRQEFVWTFSWTCSYGKKPSYSHLFDSTHFKHLQLP